VHELLLIVRRKQTPFQSTADEYGNLSPYAGEFLEGFTRFQVVMKIVRDPKPEERFVISTRPLNADNRYPRLNVIGLGMSELSLGSEGETVLRGHVDRLVDGSILWTNVCLSDSFTRCVC